MIIIFLFLLIFFSDIIFFGQNLFLGDNLLVIIPHKIFILENLQKGILPLWNPHMWTGFPEVADISIGLFDPFNVLYFIFPGFTGIKIVLLVCFFMIVLGTYFFLKDEGYKKYAAVAGAVIFSFSGALINFTPDMARIESLALFPLTLIAIKKKKMLTSVFLLTLNFLVGRTQQYHMIMIFFACFILFYSGKKQVKKDIVFLLLISILPLLLGAFALLPQIELLKFSPRLTTGLNYNTTWSLHPASFIRFLLADFWGRHNEGSFWGPDVTYAFGYIGFFPLILLILNFKKLLTKKTIFFVFFSIFSILIALGKFNPIYRFFLLVPGMSFFRNPSSWLVIYSFGVAYLTAYLLNLYDFKAQTNLRKFFLFIGVGFSILGLIMLYLFQFTPNTPHQIFLEISQFLNKNLSTFHNLNVDREIFFFIGRNMFIIGVLSIVLSIKFNLKMFVIIIFLDLFIFARGDLVLAPNTDIFESTKASRPIQFLQKNLKSYRFISTSEFLPVRGISLYMNNLAKRPPFVNEHFWPLPKNEPETFREYKKEITLLPPNIFVAFNLSSINGYSGFYLNTYLDYFKKPSTGLSASAKRVAEVRSANNDILDPSHITFNYVNLDDPRISATSVKYILSNEKLNLKNFKEIKLYDEFFVYQNPDVKERVQVFDKKNHLKFQSESIDEKNPNKVIVKISNKFQKGDYLILRDAYYPGWKAFDQNNKELKLERNGIFRKVYLEKNTEVIMFKFEPSPFYSGLKISLVTIILILIFSFLHKSRNKQSTKP